MSSDLSAARTRVSATDLLPQRGGALAASIEGIGDIAMAGERSGYAHLSPRALPTAGQLVAAARAAAEALAETARWPHLRGAWQPVPESARGRARDRTRVTAVVLDPNGFVPLAAARPGGAAPASDVLYLVSGRAHAVVTGDAGRLLAVQELAAGRARVIGSAGGHQLINTGTAVALVVRATA